MAFNLPKPLLTDMMIWFGDGHTHKDSGYQSGNRQTIWNQLSLMEQVGVIGPRITWMGPANPYTHEAAQEIAFQCWQKRMKFCLLIDPNISKNKPGAGMEEDIISALLDPGTQQMLNSSAYLPQKYICEFSTGADFKRIGAQFPGLKFLSKHSGFTWPEKAGLQTTAADNSYQTIRRDSATGTVRIAGLAALFDNGGWYDPATKLRDYGLDVWKGKEGIKATVIDALSGQFWKSLVDIIPDSADYVSLISFNDIDEGHGIWEAVFACLYGTPIT